MLQDYLWVILTLVAAAAQTARNSMQKDLTARLGTVGATHVRFLYGLPFSLLFLLVVARVTGERVPVPDVAAASWMIAGAAFQIVATGMMLAAMRTRSFVAAITYTKIEPVLVLPFAAIFLAELPSALAIFGVFVTTAGVVMMSWTRRADGGDRLRSTALGLGAGVFFAISAVCYRGGILALPEAGFVIRATTMLVTALAFQTVALTLYLYVFDRPALVGLVRAWRASLPAGFFGALASQFWFLAFALQSPSLVRSLGLVEILFAQVISRRIFKQRDTLQELAGMALVAVGVIVILLGD